MKKDKIEKKDFRKRGSNYLFGKKTTEDKYTN